MKARRLVPWLLATVLLIAGCSGSPAAQPRESPSTGTSPSTSTTKPASDWDVDLDVLLFGIERVHPNPWWRIPKTEFVSRLNRLRTTIPAMDRTAAEIAVMELVATIDGHTAVYPTDLGYRYYAIEFYEFADGTYVLAAPDHPELVGGRLTGIGSTSLKQAQQLLSPLVSHDNEQTTKARLPLYLVMPEALQAKGIVSDPEHPNFHITTTSGKRVKANPKAFGWDLYQSEVGWYPVALPPRARPLSQSRRAEPLWSQDLGDGNFYVQYNEVRADVEPTVQRIKKAIARPDFHRLVVDLRHNGGGDNTTYGPLLQELKDPRLSGKLSVIIGRETFSAAENFAIEVEKTTGAVFVGEPTGGRPNLYGDVRDVVLPRSGIIAHVSSRYWEMSTTDDTRDALAPDIPVSLTSADYFAHRDPILAAAIRGR